MKNLIGRVKEGIGKGVAVGLLGLTLGLGAPAIAHADNNLNKINELSRALLRIGHEMEDEQDQEYLDQQKEIQKEQKQYMDNQLELQREKDQQYQAKAQLPQNQKHYFACNTSNGWTYPNAYEGIKLVDYDLSAKTGSSWKLDVIGPKGNTVFESKASLQKDGMIMQIGTKDTARFFYEKGGLGNYRAIFTLDGNETEADFTIVE